MTSGVATGPGARSGAGGGGAAAWALIGLGAILSLAVLLGPGVERLSFTYLWGYAFFWTLFMGGLFFVGLHHVTGAVWSTLLRRVGEMFAAPVVPAAVLFLPVLLFALLGGTTGLYPWVDHGGDPVIAGKEAWLNLPFFILRVAVYFGLWWLYVRLLLRPSLATDHGADGAAAARTMRRRSAHFMLVFAATASFAAIDWLMSLEPHWYSTIFPVYVFAGMVLTALAAITLVVLRLRRRPGSGLEKVKKDHLYNLGALQFAFTCFWAYIAFSQYMLIWYANIPEETIYFVHRLEHGWQPVTIALAVLRFGVPFLLLLPRRAKMNPRVLALSSILLIAGQLLDLYWLIAPQLSPGGPRFGWPDLGPLLLVGGVILLWIGRFARAHPMVAAGDPDHERSCEFHL